MVMAQGDVTLNVGGGDGGSSIGAVVMVILGLVLLFFASRGSIGQLLRALANWLYEQVGSPPPAVERQGWDPTDPGAGAEADQPATSTPPALERSPYVTPFIEPEAAGEGAGGGGGGVEDPRGAGGLGEIEIPWWAPGAALPALYPALQELGAGARGILAPLTSPTTLPILVPQQMFPPGMEPPTGDGGVY